MENSHDQYLERLALYNHVLQCTNFFYTDIHNGKYFTAWKWKRNIGKNVFKRKIIVKKDSIIIIKKGK